MVEILNTRHVKRNYYEKAWKLFPHNHYLFNFFTFPALLNWIFIPFLSPPKKGNQMDVLHQRYPREEAMMMVEKHQLTHELETLNEGTNPPWPARPRSPPKNLPVIVLISDHL